MKRTWILACALALSTAAGAAAAPDGAAEPVLLLEQATSAGLCATAQIFAAGNGGQGTLSTCNATANCASGTVNCSGNSTCSAVDRNCAAGERGHVTCDGVTTWCPTSCTQIDWCAECNQTQDCFACCRCAGGSALTCLNACGG